MHHLDNLLIECAGVLLRESHVVCELRTILSTGCRRSELFSLAKDDINLDKATIRLRNGNRSVRSYRIIPVGPNLLSWLCAHEPQGSGVLFAPMHRRYMFRRLRHINRILCSLMIEFESPWVELDRALSKALLEQSRTLPDWANRYPLSIH